MRTRSVEATLEDAESGHLLQIGDAPLDCDFGGQVSLHVLANAASMSIGIKRGREEERHDPVVKHARFDNDATVDKPAAVEVTAGSVDGTEGTKEVPLTADEEAVIKGASSAFRSLVHEHVAYALSDKAPRQSKRLLASAMYKTVSVPKDSVPVNASSSKAQVPTTKAATETTPTKAVREDLRCTAPDCPFVAQKPSGLVVHKRSQYVSSIRLSW